MMIEFLSFYGFAPKLKSIEKTPAEYNMLGWP